ncbi:MULTISPECIES: non-ribosomal peptide synthetase [Streptomyces]|uniref:Non-ribosomal peptide synthetase n=2 Tax=Streptomyces rimosus subsp. rimosus TaxID=132474 RepID=L8EH63_STRR1|nr:MULTISPECIES: non-ribosomal peptide synthetase [Streptomyces]KOG80060.1 non-ribosomal peptide synthetase module [Kitasatospora aureofaciens]MYT48517.1 amino acid adenylation domain-containing protein [Streptomyces sp. SID5471]KEF08330.1 non-ribosomal peptide synthetase module [Streptomyces rimosus]KOT32100.1 non-ribosomal peptide synthetase module [Streptomyces sp. NRRL WC-3701]KOT33089.1 non-ribosomal peptide synthetase module [Streptomyces rimosus subsp. rimosus]
MTSIDAGLPGLISHYARTTPDALAVTDGETTLTYAGLEAAARDFAQVLRERGIRPGDAVGVLLPHSVPTVVTQLAVWCAGGHYVPLDPDYPPPRIATMLETAGAVLTVGSKDLTEAAGIPGDRALLPPAGSEQAGDATPFAEYDPDAVAYVMFTSGSTGRPKGVAVTHRGIAGLAHRPEYVTITPRDRVLFHSPVTFDASAFEVWGALANGAAVAVSTADRLSPTGLARDAERLGATVTVLTTALFHHLAARRSPLFGVLRGVLAGGEALSAQHARSVLRAHPWLELVNGYGPTEATTFATAHRVTDADCDGPPPIGRPVAGTTAYVMDEHGEPVAPGVRGELWLGGPRLALGYVGQPDRTAERFVDHPAAGRLYRTGDVVSARPDGTLDFHGRTDDQIKVRGFRIEPGEIEHALREHAGVADAAVVVQRPAPDDARLVAFVVPEDGAAPGAAALRAHLEERLPAHLVPNVWGFVDALPMTGVGKVDRRALAERPVDGDGTDSPPAPAASLSPLQQVVADLWSQALGFPVDDPAADFIALGGHSLLALCVVEDLREDLGVEMSLADFFAAPTVAAQAAHVEQALLRLHEGPGTPDDAPSPSVVEDPR